MSTPPILANFLLLLTAPVLLTASFPLVKPGCNQTCGDVTIPYPFGMTEDCYLNQDFGIYCNHSYSPPQPFILDTPINVTNISLEDHQLHILKLIGRKCYSPSLEVLKNAIKPIFRLPKFPMNSTLNKFVAVGCDTTAFIQGYNRDHRKYTTGCISYCHNKTDIENGTCAGGGCCETSIPEKLSEFNVTVGSFYNHRYVESFNPCSYAFVVEKVKFNFSLHTLLKLHNVEKLPVVLDWAIGNENETCRSARRNVTSYACQKNTYCVDNKRSYSGYRCFCKKGYRGNPYLSGVGCQDIDECQESNNCTYKERCVNIEGSYKCTCPKGYYGRGVGNEGCSPKSKRPVAWILAGIAVGTVILVMGGYFWWRGKELSLKEENFRKNGGLILQQKLDRQDGSSINVTIFTAAELKKATNNFHDSKIIGQGGSGIVYRGCLEDNNEVAIKKSKTVDHDQIGQFINEVFVLSQINHRNVVKLLGCCLEDEVPLLVYEFISNGTLFEHLRDKIKANILRWDVRLRIAAETAGAISYLHSAASPPIIHRDVKTMNILLDENWTAKVADFGSSRLIPFNEGQISTMVQGTLGYLDPEYFQTCQLTEKSDVYSFGVVLVELLTGKRPVCFSGSENERSLANLFLSSLKEGQLLEVLEDFVVSDESIEEVKEVAMLAKRCLNVKGEYRPTMKEVSLELEGLKLAAKRSWIHNADLDSDEIQSLLGEHSNALKNVDSSMMTTTFSVEHHVMLSPDGGR